jgi:hypothetical protein
MARLLSLNVGLARDITWQGKRVHTAIWRTPVHGRPILRRLNIDGDAATSSAGRFFGRGPRGLPDWPFLKREGEIPGIMQQTHLAGARVFEGLRGRRRLHLSPEPDPAIHPCWSRRRGARCRVAHHLPRHRGSRAHAWFQRIPSCGQPTALRLAKGENVSITA